MLLSIVWMLLSATVCIQAADAPKHPGISSGAALGIWPVLPTMWHSFELQPVNFFARNPALDLP